MPAYATVHLAFTDSVNSSIMVNYDSVYSKTYRKQGKIRWAKFLHFSRFSRAPQKFSHESLYKLCIMALFKCCNVRHRESFPVKTTLGGIRESLAQRIFSRLQ